ncbi:NAD(P)H-dependent glycerol-3-phosphate dehydrogenase [Actinospongicola halichondriae]|uniref:NAD(P)H-dependent glycerol-3-phosphate dehydrogenase n=1 Tax=Actinospongicola halichondriae TaxID=3236844 RepID=UPI003D440CB0
MSSIRVAVLGGGSWGTTVAHLCAHNAPTVLWCRSEDTASEINADHQNKKYLEGYDLHESLTATTDMAEALDRADLLVMGVPSSAFRQTLRAARSSVRPWIPVVSLTKGFEIDTGMRMTQVIHDEMPGHPVGVLTGPNLAKEILAGAAAASVVAMHDHAVAESLQDVFHSNLFRVYTNDDLVGCELGGALKNVIAIASGMADGLGAGDNTRAAVITRGLNEITRLGVALGGDPLTFAGLAGMGDLIATCISPQSRNRTVGQKLGEGMSIDEVIADMNQVAEGVKSCRIVQAKGRELGVQTPITDQVVAVCHEGATALDAYSGLLGRENRAEMHGLERP